MFDAIRERILVPELVAYAVEKALEIVRADLAPKPERIETARADRLAEIDAELEMLRRMATRSGRAAHVAPLLAELDAERASLAAPATGGVAPGINVESLRPAIEARVVEMREAFAGAPDAKRAAFRALVGERRLRVLADAERDGFRVEGRFELALETRDARAEGARASRIGNSAGAIRTSAAGPRELPCAGSLGRMK